MKQYIKNKNTILILILLVIVIITGFIFIFLKNKNLEEDIEVQEVFMSDPVNTVLDFYEAWKNALQSPDTDPYKKGLNNLPILSKDLRNRLSDIKEYKDGEVDPVLCQNVIPDIVSGQILYEQEDKVQVLVLSRDEGVTGQAVFKLNKHNNGWYIDNIECSPGEFGPEREFSFENRGVLIKDVPSPYDNKNWHLLFVENNEAVLVPLFFNEESICVSLKKEEGICKTEQLPPESIVIIYGELTEYGADVKKLEFSE